MIGHDILQIFRRISKSNITLPRKQSILQVIPVVDSLIVFLDSSKAYCFLRFIRPAVEGGGDKECCVEAHGSVLGCSESPSLR